MSMRNIWLGCALGLLGLQIAAAQKKAPEKPKTTNVPTSESSSADSTAGSYIESDAEIQKVYKTDDKIPFPVMARSLLTGDEAIPFYGYLTKGRGAPLGGNVH